MTEASETSLDGDVPAESARGSHITDAQGRELIDYDCRGGAVILGHANEQVVTAVTKAARRGLGTLSDARPREKFAGLLLGCFKHFSSAVFCESGLAALHASVAAARRHTGRRRIISCGCGPVGDADQGRFNDIDSVRERIGDGDSAAAAVYVAPVRTCEGVTRPDDGFLGGLRDLCDARGTLLVFDERDTAFRLAFGGAQGIYDIHADVTILGGVIGGGLPLGAVLADDAITSIIARTALPANQLAMACGLATLEPLRDGAVYGRLEALGASLNDGLTKAFAAADSSARANRSGSMLTVRFDEDPRVNADRYRAFRAGMIDAGILLPGEANRPWFLTAAHDEKDIKATLDATAAALSR